MAARISAAGTQEYTTSSGMPASNVWTCTWWTYQVEDRNTYSTLLSVGSAGAYVDVSTASDGTTVGVYDPSNYSGTPLGATAFSLTTWYRLGLVVDGTTASFYRAAVSASSLTASTASGDFTASNPPTSLVIGDSVNAGDYPWSARVAAFKMWGAALTQGEVEAELSQYLPRRTGNLLRFHPFLRTEAVDYSGSGNTLSGGTGSTTEDGPPIPWSRLAPRVVITTDAAPTASRPVMSAWARRVPLLVR